MSILKRQVTRYWGHCNDCGWTGDHHSRELYAERDLSRHECGVHRQQYDNTGGYRGGLGGKRVSCVCGKHWVEPDVLAPFVCPNDRNADR